MPRGTAGCAHDACPKIGDADTVVIADGSVIPTTDLRALLRHHRVSQSAMTVVVYREPCGSGQTVLRPAGIYVVERRVLEEVPPQGFHDIKESLIPKLHARGERVVPFEAEDCCPRVFDAASYLAVNQWLIPRTLGSPTILRRQGYTISGHLAIHPAATLEPGAHLIGPVLLGPDVVVESGATLVGPVSLGAETVVERGALVARSVIWQRCTVSQAAAVDRSVLTDDAMAGAGETVSGTFRVAVSRRAPQRGIPLEAEVPSFADPVSPQAFARP
jgi:NDP-sugar pyrophosphorylase family protein